jgi:PAS domain S-box-containing protein
VLRWDSLEGLKGSAANSGEHHPDQLFQGSSLQLEDLAAAGSGASAKPIDAQIWTVLDWSSISILNQDRTLRYTWASGPFAGYPADYIQNRTDAELFTPNDALKLTELKRLSLEECLEVHKEAEIFANGNNFVFDTFIKPLRNENGAVMGISSAFRDITEQRMAQTELKHAQAAADAAVRAKAEFLAVMSHEVRTPLNAIVGMAELLQYEDLTFDQRDCAQIIHSSAEALLSTISNILEISKIERGCANLDNEVFDLASCIRGSLDLMALKAREKGLKLMCNLDHALPRTIIGDENRICQVLANLLDNAVKFTDHGEILVRVQLQRDAESLNILFSVTDTGIGIPDDRMTRLFQSFSQVDMSSTRRYGGMGTGLAISRKLVELMGGKMWAESKEGIGSAFYFTIPAGENRIKGHKSPNTSLPSKFAPQHHINLNRALRVLIAEDNSINQKVMLRMLSKLGIRADVAANGFDVIRAMQCQEYDLILMDVQMPDMDGIETTFRIRKLWPIGGPRIIAITACALEGDRERCLESGMDGYIAKPVRLSALKDALEGSFLT